MGSTTESKLPESPQPIPIMNDYLKYFNQFSKEGDDRPGLVTKTQSIMTTARHNQ